MPVLTATADATGVATVLPPYSLADGTYAVSARQVVGGVQGPLSAPVVFSMPNAAKSATLALIARMSAAPPAGRAEAIYAAVSGIMAAGVWPKMDVLSLQAAHHEQAGRLNWIGPAYDLAGYNSPIFAADRGFKGDGASAYLEASGYNPSAGGTRYALNDACAGLWVLTPNTLSGGIDLYMGNTRLDRRTTLNDHYHVRINDGTTAYGSGGDVGGFFGADRPNSATKLLFRNGTLNASLATASTANAPYLRVLGTGTGIYSNVEVAAAFAGASLTDAQHAALYAALRTYLLAVGALSA